MDSYQHFSVIVGLFTPASLLAVYHVAVMHIPFLNRGILKRGELTISPGLRHVRYLTLCFTLCFLISLGIKDNIIMKNIWSGTIFMVLFMGSGFAAFIQLTENLLGVFWHIRNKETPKILERISKCGQIYFVLHYTIFGVYVIATGKTLHAFPHITSVLVAGFVFVFVFGGSAFISVELANHRKTMAGTSDDYIDKALTTLLIQKIFLTAFVGLLIAKNVRYLILPKNWRLSPVDEEPRADLMTILIVLLAVLTLLFHGNKKREKPTRPQPDIGFSAANAIRNAFLLWRMNSELHLSQGASRIIRESVTRVSV